jgi:bifunctional NMN adenylyltransferase/nudix hydrolase
LGLSEVRNTKKNPLDFNARKQMLLEEFPKDDLEIHYINDVKSDEEWSKNLDEQIAKHLNPGQKITLYGSRDSFLQYYTGKNKTVELESDTFISGTEMRKTISAKTIASADFRAGVIYSTQSRYPTAYQTVDIAIFNEDMTKILLGRKPKETKHRFIGGFSDPRSLSLEIDAKREVHEETGIDEVSEPVYIGSTIIEDWRYPQDGDDRIKTAFFWVKMLWGRPQASDDIAEVKWFEIDNLFKNYKDLIVKEHWVLVEMLIKNMANIEEENLANSLLATKDRNV